MKRYLRAFLSLTAILGLVIAVWPMGQTAYARWNQRQLQAQWQNAKKPSTSQSSKVTARPASLTSKTSKTGAHSQPGGKTIGATKEKKAHWPATRIVIPELNVDAVVVSGWDEASLRLGPGHYPESALPGQRGNCVIAGHRNVYGSYFRNLDHLLAGSNITLKTPQSDYRYRVISVDTAFDNDPTVAASSSAPDAPTELTLVTCTIPKTAYRIIVKAQLDDGLE
jgi:LPXTG-site transpeptidase (sortase) family protein